jgi:predicted enzyme related to lactoylglutathione lyase
MKTKQTRGSRRNKPTSPRGKAQTHIRVRAVDFVMYCARDIRRARAFYQKLFQFKRGEEWNNLWSEFDTAPVTFCLNGPDKRPKRNWLGAPAIAFAVPDIHQAIELCRRRKVKVLMEPVETSVCWMSFIADPAGNRICLHQRKDGTAG